MSTMKKDIYQRSGSGSIDAQMRKSYDELPEDLRILQDYARKLGVSLIWLDRDADVMEGLPVYEW